MRRSDAAIRRCCWTALVAIKGTLAAHRYVDDILGTVFLAFLLQYPDLTFQQNNAKPRTKRVAMNCLTIYQTLPWPARLKDPSPIEHVRDMMGRRLHLPGNIDDMARQLVQISHEIPQETMRVLYHAICDIVWQLKSRLELDQLLIELITF
ncbi:transposable element Tcb1 transposase [Trichonephila clavipes]|nr:transposable element Tcb1 transposase [Trichonephila clavipes]